MNKQTGLLVKEASWAGEKIIIRTLTKKKMKAATPNFNQLDSLHKLNRPEQVIMFRLRTGHNRLNAHMYSKFKVGNSEMCPCNAHITTAGKLLQHWQLCDALGRDMWPEPKPLRDKLYDNLEELRRPVAFVRATSISVWRARKKKKCSLDNCEEKLTCAGSHATVARIPPGTKHTIKNKPLCVAFVFRPIIFTSSSSSSSSSSSFSSSSSPCSPPLHLPLSLAPLPLSYGENEVRWGCLFPFDDVCDN